MIEKLDKAVLLAKVTGKYPHPGAAILTVADKLNDLIEAYNEHTHEYHETDGEGYLPADTSKPLPPQSSKQENE